jgi:hypothetical protein
MIERMDFLAPDVGQIRQSILDIDDSYNNEWDILAELAQNSIDAIRMTTKKKGKIHIVFDCRANLISFADNGIGIDPSELPKLLRPFATNKRGSTKAIGEKGVGLTFTIFTCDDFKIITGTNKKKVSGSIHGAYTWKRGTDSEPLKLEINEIHVEDDNDFSTTVTLSGVKETPIFNLSIDQLIFVLRTRTALGNTKYKWERDIDIDISITYIDSFGEKIERKVPFTYYYPIENLNDTAKIDLKIFK